MILEEIQTAVVTYRALLEGVEHLLSENKIECAIRNLWLANFSFIKSTQQLLERVAMEGRQARVKDFDVKEYQEKVQNMHFNVVSGLELVDRALRGGASQASAISALLKIVELHKTYLSETSQKISELRREPRAVDVDSTCGGLSARDAARHITLNTYALLTMLGRPRYTGDKRALLQATGVYVKAVAQLVHRIGETAMAGFRALRGGVPHIGVLEQVNKIDKEVQRINEYRWLLASGEIEHFPLLCVMGQLATILDAASAAEKAAGEEEAHAHAYGGRRAQKRVSGHRGIGNRNKLNI